MADVNSFSPSVAPVVDRSRSIAFAARWWTFAARGLVTLAFGVIVFFAAETRLSALVMLFGAFALLDGMVHFTLAALRRGGERQLNPFIAVGALASIVAGVVAFAWTDVTPVGLVYLIAGWAAVTGLAELCAGVRLRKDVHGAVLLAFTGSLSLAFGALLAWMPGEGAAERALWISSFLVILGSMLVAVALQVRSWHAPRDREPPSADLRGAPVM